MNEFNFIGRIYKDLELKMTTSGKEVLDLPLAITNGKDDSTFVTIKLFNQSASNTNKYCSKGDLINVSGLVRNNNWEDKDGNKHYDYSFIATRVLFLNTKHKEENKAVEEVKTNTDAFEEDNGIVLTDDDLPF